MNARAYLAELLGTFLFMMIGYASVAAFNNTATPVPGLLVVPFSFGFGLLAAIVAFGHMSGAHFNPAVTVAMALDRRTTPLDALGYIIAQVIGVAIIGPQIANGPIATRQMSLRVQHATMSATPTYSTVAAAV